MLKLKLVWELETGERYEDWTYPIELSLAEKELYNGKSIIKILTEDAAPSSTLLLFLGHKMQQRITKKNENFETWKSKVTDISAVDFEAGNFIKPEASGEQQSN